jgi:hypothetical protein
MSMVFPRAAVLRLFLLAGGVLFAGCGSRLETFSVSGTVRLPDGSPLVGGIVSMDSVDQAVSGTARTDEQGRFAMTTLRPGDGLPRGTYRVVVLPPAPEEADRSGAAGFDARFMQYTTSGLEVIVEDKPATIDIQLTK